MLIPIVFGDSGADPEEFGGFAKEIFLEDIFDPITKLRRGRIFTCRALLSQPMEWIVTDPLHPEKKAFIGQAYGERRALQTYCFASLSAIRPHTSTGKFPPVLLGKSPFMAFWRIVAIESVAIGPPVLSLRPIQSFEDIPELHLRTIPSAARKAAQHAWDEVAACIHVGNPSDRIDRCRNLLTIVFAYSAKQPNLDLGAAINAWAGLNEDNRKSIASHCGQIVARLHSKTKHSEQVSRLLSPASDADAQLALRCTAFVLTHFRWAK